MMSILTSEGTCYHCHHILFPTQILLLPRRRRLHIPDFREAGIPGSRLGGGFTAHSPASSLALLVLLSGLFLQPKSWELPLILLLPILILSVSKSCQLCL